jgi:peptidoglycan/xylan/chitin deacetylase (PgdA/CDA1 family)
MGGRRPSVSVLFLPEPGSLALVQKKVLLIFDDGLDVRYTPQVLDTLAQHDAKGLFFVVGSQVDCNPALLQRTTRASIP